MSSNNDEIVLKDIPVYKQNKFLVGGGVGLLLMSGILCYFKYKK